MMGSTVVGYVPGAVLRIISPTWTLSRSLQPKIFAQCQFLPRVLPQRMYFCTRRKLFGSSKMLITNNLLCPSPCSLTCRSSSNTLGLRNFSLTYLRENETDAGDAKGKLVYKGTLTNMIKGLKLFSFSTSLVGLVMQPAILFQNQELPTGLKLGLAAAINFLIFLNPILIHFITKRYVRELHWDSETGIFMATTYTFFLRTKKLVFLVDDVEVPALPGMFTSLKVNGDPLFFDPGAFVNQEAYVHLMGFNKPLDWELPRKSDEDKGKK